MDSVIHEILPEIVVDGAFGKNVSFVSFAQNKDIVVKDQFMSNIVFGTILTSDNCKYSVVIKLKLSSGLNLMVCDIAFHNEITIYESFIPFGLASRDSLGSEVDVPSMARYFYGRNKCGELKIKDLIILENVGDLGYRPSEERVFLDYDHLVSALQAIAKFHALSYMAKHTDSAGFQKIVADIRYTQWSEDGEFVKKPYCILACKRGVDRLLKRDGDRYRDHEHLRRLSEIIQDSNNAIRRALEPREPLSVMCHGDFNRNNLMFRYERHGGVPVDTLLLDFGTPIYGSPALDLSFFLYLNTTQKTRENRWNRLLDVYCDTLAANVPSHVRVPDRSELDAEMVSAAFYGFSYALFFIPVQIQNTMSNVSVETTFENCVSTWGGETADEAMADMVQHFVDMGYTNV